MKLLAAAVVTAFAAPVALAQSPASNVTIYGTLQTEFINIKGDGAGANPDYQRRNRIGTPGSFFIGFRGSEAVGGGLRVVWQVEQNVGGGDGTGASNTWGSRNTFVGLSGGFGTVMLGNYDSPLKRVLGVNNVMNMGLTGPQGMEPVMTNNGGANRFSNRISNSLTYHSPTVAGFRVEAQYQANEGRSQFAGPGAVDPFEYGVSLQYAGGPFRAGIGYSKHEDFRGAGLNDDAILVSGSWTSGPFLVHAAYSRLEYDVAGGDRRRNNWMIGGQYSLAQHRFRLQYQEAGDSKGTAGGAAIGNLAVVGGSTGGKIWGASYGYALSKRSEVYGFYSYINNENNGILDHSGGHGGVTGTAALSAGMDVSVWGVGIRHSF